MNANLFAIITMSVFTMFSIGNVYADSDNQTNHNHPNHNHPNHSHLKIINRMLNSANTTNSNSTIINPVPIPPNTTNSTVTLINKISNSTMDNSTALAFNQTSISANTTNSTVTLINKISNSTIDNSTAIAFNQTSISANTTNSTVTLINKISNSTIDNSTAIAFNQTSISANTTNSTNDSDMSSNGTEDTAPVPDPSWEFNASSATDETDNTNVQSSNENSLNLNGEDYLTQSVNSTRNLSALTLSVWIKPDYSAGSPQFTVLSEANSFVLAVNNNIPPVKKASFSVFDGIKWNTVFSNSTIPEGWTHLVAAFDGTSISIYINGTQESILKLPGATTIALNGTLTTKTADNLSSDANIVIGAYLNTIRNTVNNKFSGNIENVTLYDSPLTPAQITQLR